MIPKPFKTEASSYIYSAWNNEFAIVPQHVYELFDQDTDAQPTPESMRSLAAGAGLMPLRGITLSVFSESRFRERLERSPTSILRSQREERPVLRLAAVKSPRQGRRLI
jgi:hypothetical protein